MVNIFPIFLVLTKKKGEEKIPPELSIPQGIVKEGVAGRL